MKLGERARVRFLFGCLGAVPVFLAGWLGYVQVVQGASLPRRDRAPLRLVAATAEREVLRTEVVPAPRGTIVDRNGAILAIDCEAYDVRARIAVPRLAQASRSALQAWLAEVAGDFATALASDPELADRAASRRAHLAAFGAVLEREFAVAAAPADGPLPKDHPCVADVLVQNGVDCLAVVEALREVGDRRGSVALHFLRGHRRAYPGREFTYGLVGHVDSAWTTEPGSTEPALVHFGACGLESLAALQPAPDARRRFLQDGTGRPYFLAPAADVAPLNVLHATIDLELQRAAVRELTAQAEAGATEGTVTIPQWGALVLIELATGDVLAAASWHRDVAHAKHAAFAPYQSLYEPGSIVKPLVFAHALEQGVLDWEQEFDCAPGSADYRRCIGSVGKRVVRDDHACSVLTPHGILVNSSNIGATYVGTRLDRDQWRDYMRFFGFGESLGLRLPNERKGGTPPQSFDPSVSARRFQRDSATSFSFGYELQVTALHMARAYLRLFRGEGAGLRLCRGVEIGGRWHDAPAAYERGRAFSPATIDAVRAAMVDVVSNDPHATGFHLHGRMLKQLGVDLHGVIAGKTGTAATSPHIPGRGKVAARNASFVGFMPVEAPRWLAVCVLQKDDDARFYGGSYAAPPVVRLLLQTERLEQRRRLRQGPQVSATPGDSGWGGGAPETILTGR